MNKNIEQSKISPHIGTHILAEFWGAKEISDPVQIKELLKTAVARAGATALGDAVCVPAPRGLAAVILLSESHFAMHTSPEHDYIALDIFTCGDGKYLKALAYINEVLEPEKTKIEEIKRGQGKCLTEENMPPENHEHSRFYENQLPGRRGGNVAHSFLVQEKLYEGQSCFQEILIFDGPMYGRALVLDGIIQFTETDEFIYHEMLVHPVMLAHPSPRRILVMGGGDGGVLRECLKYNCVEEIVLVEIDEKVIELCREYFPQVNQGAFDDERVEIRVGDAREMIEDFNEHFDVVFVDSSDSIGSSKALHSLGFYQKINRSLKPDGMLTCQMGSLLDQSYLSLSYRQLGQIFHYQSLTRINIPSYNCGEYCFMIAAKTEDVDNVSLEVLKERLSARLPDSRLKYYTPEMQLYTRLMPRYLNIK